jgi:hypothetical protein
MKKNILSIFTVSYLLSTSVLANETQKFKGYSYAIIGLERLSYTEKVSILPLETQVVATSPMSITGGVYRYNDRWDFSLDAMATLLPSASKETWSINASTAGDDFKQSNNIGNNTLQQDSFELANSSLQFLTHYKFNEQARWLTGMKFTRHNFKRFDFESEHTQIVSLETGVIEEKVGALALELGVGYESAPVQNTDNRYNARLLFGIPVWRSTENTGISGVEFSESSGWGFVVDASYTFQILKNIQLGVYGAYDYILRGGSKITRNNSVFELPKNIVEFVRIGINFVWKLD